MVRTASSFPRLISRGLIEAIQDAFRRAGLYTFPRLISRGLIEAILKRGKWPRLQAFPRLISRGLIEACSPMGEHVFHVISATDQSRPH